MYKKILMPVDIFEMDLSDKAIRHAEYLAQADAGEITLVNILPTSNGAILRGFNADIKKFEEYMKNESVRKMRELSRLFKLPEGRIHIEVRFGNVRDEIVAMTREQAFDVIVIGSRKPGISTHLLGSSAESVLRYASVPVLVIR